MNTCELILFALAGLLMVGYLLWEFSSWRTALLLVGLSLAPLYLSIERTSQFLTIDEENFIIEPLNIGSQENLEWWFTGRITEGGISGSFRTSDVLLGIVSGIHHRFFQWVTDVQMMMLLKSLHWLLVFVVFLMIHHLLSRHFVSESNRRSFFVIFIYTALLLPTNALALKIFNHDGLSMALGGMAIFCISVALKIKEPRYALAAIFFSFLAAQEKMMASPILPLALATYGFLKTLSDGSRFRYVKLLGYLLIGFAIALGTGAIGALIVARLRHWRSLTELLLSAPEPIVSWTWPVITFTMGRTASRSGETLLLLLLASLAGVYLLAVVLVLTKPFVAKHATRLARGARRANLLIVPAIIAVGVIGAYAIDAYLAPMVPIESGNYQPLSNFLNVFRHFNAATLWEHLAAYTAFLYAIAIGDTPTIYWLLLLAAVVLARVYRWRHRPALDTELLFMVGALMPLGYGLLQIPYTIPPSARYFNIGMFLMATMLCVKAVEMLSALSQAQKLVGAVIFASALTLEALPFGPLYGPFRPIWLNYNESRSAMVAPGRVDPVWGGWGEELMLVGQQLEVHCQPTHDTPLGDADSLAHPCEAIRVHSSFLGEWLDEIRL